MINDLKISRELAERLLRNCDVESDYDDLLAIFAAEPLPPLIQTPHANGELIAAQATIAQQAQEMTRLKKMADNYSSLLMDANARIADLEATQHQDEPDAWALLNGNGQIRDLTERWDVAKHWDGNVQPLFTSQPAPVAVVLPERQEVDKYGEFYDSGWNDCLDKVKELNQ